MLKLTNFGKLPVPIKIFNMMFTAQQKKLLKLSVQTKKTSYKINYPHKARSSTASPNLPYRN